MFDTISLASLSSVVGGQCTCACAQQPPQGGDPGAGGDPQQPPMQQPQQGGTEGAPGGSSCQQLLGAIMGLVNQFAGQQGGAPQQ